MPYGQPLNDTQAAGPHSQPTTLRARGSQSQESVSNSLPQTLHQEKMFSS
jgi:hypothetical protein